MTMYSVLVHNQKSMHVIGTLCIEADTAAEATRIGQDMVKSHQSFGTLNAHAQVTPALDASQIKHLDWLDSSSPVDPNQVRGRPNAKRLRRIAAAAPQNDAQHWWPRLKGWWATRHNQFEQVEQDTDRAALAELR